MHPIVRKLQYQLKGLARDSKSNSSPPIWIGAVELYNILCCEGFDHYSYKDTA